MGDTLEANLKKGVEGGVESGAVRDESFALGLSFTGLDKEGCGKAFYDLNAPDSSFTKLRFDVQGQEDRASIRRSHALVRCLGLVGKRGGVPDTTTDNARRLMGPGCVHVDHLRAKLGEGVHGYGGVHVPGGFDMAKALLTFTTNVNEDMDSSLGAMGLEPKGMPHSLVQKASHFSSGFLGDLFRNGVVVDGERIVASGTQDPKEMERVLDEFIAGSPTPPWATRSRTRWCSASRRRATATTTCVRISACNGPTAASRA